MQLWPLKKLVPGALGALGLKILLLAGAATTIVFLLGAAITEYRATARQTILITALAEDLMEAEVARLTYLLSGDPAQYEQARSNLAEIAAARSDVDMLVPANSPERAAIEGIIAEGAEMDATLADRSSRQVEFGAAFESYRAHAAEVEAALRRVIAEGRLPERVGGEDTVRVVMRLVAEIAAVERAVADVDPAALEAAVARMRSSVETLDGASGVSADAGALVAAAETLVPLKRALAEGDAASAAQAVAAVEAADALIDGIVARQNALGPRMESIVTAGKIAMPLIGLVAVALATALAVWASRTIAGRMDEALGAIRRIFRGDIERPVTGAEQPNEVGEIVTALAAFRDNAMEAQRAEREAQEAELRRREAEREAMDRAAEEKRSAEARAAEERRKAAVFAALEAAVRDVVSAAAEGDFSRRVDVTAVDPELRDLVTLVNDLVAGVETGLSEIDAVTERLGQGDLTRGMAGSFRGTFARLQHNVDRALDSLGGLVRQMQEQASALTEQSGALTSGADDLARRAESQAASLEESSAAVTEIAASADSNASAAREAASDARQLAERADEARGVLSDTIAAMEEIEGSSKEIEDIVKVIEEIAFQTNILSLNASVEAARAGEAGRGFAVVANEVRTLAHRTSEASSTVREIIAKSSASVSRGGNSVDRTGDVIKAVLEAMTQIVGTLDRIRTASDEQASAVRDVSTALGQLDAITQKNAVAADNTRSGAQDVAGKASAMRTAVGAFRYNEQDGVGATRAIA